jgi:hypothetical protein
LPTHFFIILFTRRHDVTDNVLCDVHCNYSHDRACPMTPLFSMPQTSTEGHQFARGVDRTTCPAVFSCIFFLLLLFARGTKGIHLPPPVTSMTTKIVQLWNVVVMMMSEKCGHVTNVCDALLLLDTVAS